MGRVRNEWSVKKDHLQRWSQMLQSDQTERVRSIKFLTELSRTLGWMKVQGGKTFCASFCASFIAGSRRAFLCVDCVRFVCLSLREFWLRLNEMHKVWTFAPRKAFLLSSGICFSSLENYFGLGTTNVKGKTDHSVSLRWNKEFWTFPKRRVFFWLFIRFICELISPSFAGLN